MPPTEVMNALGEAWSKLSAKKKKQWNDKAAEDKVRFQKELQAFEAAGHEMPKRSTAVSKTKVKRAPSAYNLFMKDQYPIFAKKAGRDAGIGEVGKAIGKAWKKLGVRKKKTYQQAAEEAKQALLAEIEG